MSAAALVEQLHALGYDATVVTQGGQEFAVFPLEVPVGVHAGSTVQIALPGTDFPVNPPGGPHVSPPITHPNGNNHPSPFGEQWRYWSRPYPEWSATGRTAGDYMAHIRKLFSQITA
jgi:hypothetical protein